MSNPTAYTNIGVTVYVPEEYEDNEDGPIYDAVNNFVEQLEMLLNRTLRAHVRQTTGGILEVLEEFSVKVVEHG